MTDEPKAPASENPKPVELIEASIGEKGFSERGLQVVAVNVTPQSERPTGGGDIPPPTNAAPSGGDAPGGPASQKPSQPSE